MFRGSVKSTGYPLHSPVSPSLQPLPPCASPCAITFQLESTWKRLSRYFRHIAVLEDLEHCCSHPSQKAATVISMYTDSQKMIDCRKWFVLGNAGCLYIKLHTQIPKTKQKEAWYSNYSQLPFSHFLSCSKPRSSPSSVHLLWSWVPVVLPFLIVRQHRRNRPSDRSVSC